jgi:hypothetical protein
MIYSNFVQMGCQAFRDYCFQNSDDWEEIVIEKEAIVVDSEGKTSSLAPRLPNKLRLALIHGEVDPETRNKLI